MTDNLDIRWKQRFKNFDRAFLLMRQALERGPEVLNQLEKEGVGLFVRSTSDFRWYPTSDGDPDSATSTRRGFA